MTKQEQIKEMVSIMAASNNPFIDVPVEIMPQVAKALYNAGYRKAEEVRKETAKEIFTEERNLVKEFAEQLKARITKFIWRHNIPECIFNDIMSDLLKEYEE